MRRVKAVVIIFIVIIFCVIHNAKMERKNDTVSLVVLTSERFSFLEKNLGYFFNHFGN